VVNVELDVVRETNRTPELVAFQYLEPFSLPPRIEVLVVSHAFRVRNASENVNKRLHRDKRI
jgi:hypothetical protein